jgi:hypothetical protein
VDVGFFTNIRFLEQTGVFGKNFPGMWSGIIIRFCKKRFLFKKSIFCGKNGIFG